MKKSWRWVRNILLTVVGLAIVLALVGYSYQVIETRRFPMKGTLVDVGDRAGYGWSEARLRLAFPELNSQSILGVERYRLLCPG